MLEDSNLLENVRNGGNRGLKRDGRVLEPDETTHADIAKKGAQCKPIEIEKREE